MLLPVVGLVVAVSGAVVIMLPTVVVSKKRIQELAGTYFDENPHLLKALLQQRRFGAMGTFLVVLGTGLQVVGAIV